MKRYMMWFAVLSVTLASITPLHAQEAAGVLTREEMQKKREEVLKNLDMTVWEMERVSSAVAAPAKGEKGEKARKKQTVMDKITFKNKQLSSEAFAKEGYTPSNVTLTIEESGSAVLETMQRNDKGDVLSWRGELSDSRMGGVISKQSSQGEMINYSFRASTVGQLDAPPPAPAPTPIPAPPAEEVAPAVTGDAAISEVLPEAVTEEETSDVEKEPAV